MTSSWGPMTCLKRASVYCITVSLVRSGGTAEGWRSLEMCLQSGAALRLLTHQDTAAYTHTQTKQCFRSVAELRVMTSTPIYVHCSSLYIYIKFLKQQSQLEFIEAKSNTLTAIKLLNLHPSTAWIDQILLLATETITMILYFPGHNQSWFGWLLWPH